MDAATRISPSTAAKADSYYFTALYDETPHNYAFGVPSLYGGIGTGRLTIADPIQADLQSIGDPVALAARTQTYVDSAHTVDLSLSRQKAGGEFTLVQTYPLIVKASFTNESRDGVRPWSGSFGFANIQEIPWPVAYDTRELRISAERAMPESRVSVNAGYRLSLFDNHIDSLTFDNPYRVVDSSGPAVAMTSGAGPATGRIALYPSNEYHEGSVSTVVHQLPARGVAVGVRVGGIHASERTADPVLDQQRRLPHRGGRPTLQGHRSVGPAAADGRGVDEHANGAGPVDEPAREEPAARRPVSPLRFAERRHALRLSGVCP